MGPQRDEFQLTSTPVQTVVAPKMKSEAPQVAPSLQSDLEADSRWGLAREAVPKSVPMPEGGSVPGSRLAPSSELPL
jgi:hypothetical protein